jgi:hypothetical protein
MKRFIIPMFALLIVSGLAIAAAVKSGLGTGESPAAFNVKDITGPNKGKSLCYRCQYGARPVAAVFTREITPEITALVTELDATIGNNQGKKMAGFVVLLTDDADGGAKQLTKLAEEAKVKNIPLTVFDGNAGPADYKIAKDAAVTVLMWNKSRVQANHAFSTGKLSEEDRKAIVEDTSKILN